MSKDTMRTKTLIRAEIADSLCDAHVLVDGDDEADPGWVAVVLDGQEAHRWKRHFARAMAEAIILATNQHPARVGGGGGAFGFSTRDRDLLDQVTQLPIEKLRDLRDRLAQVLSP